MAGTVSTDPHNAVKNDDVVPRRVVGIDSVRALAALSVACAHIIGPALFALLQHTPLGTTSVPEYARYIFTGHPAVIAFFVISGFCIHWPYTRKPLPVLPFWAARFTRIMIPVMGAIILAKLGKLKFYNFWDGYILWSIVCELFYYMLYPAFLLATKLVSWRVQFYLALLLSYAVAIGIGSDQYGNAHVYGMFLNWVVGLPSWLAGCVLAERFRSDQNSPVARVVSGGEVILWRLLVAAVASMLYWSTMNTTLGYYLTMNGFALLVCFWIKAEITSSNRQEQGHLEKVGRWSYSIYLVHMPAFVILGRIMRPIWSESIQLLSFPLVLYACYFFYRKVEVPVHNYARRFFKTVKSRGLLVSDGARASGPRARGVSSDAAA